jgi:hypothetical protein
MPSNWSGQAGTSCKVSMAFKGRWSGSCSRLVLRIGLFKTFSSGSKSGFLLIFHFSTYWNDSCRFIPEKDPFLHDDGWLLWSIWGFQVSGSCSRLRIGRSKRYQVLRTFWPIDLTEIYSWRLIPESTDRIYFSAMAYDYGEVFADLKDRSHALLRLLRIKTFSNGSNSGFHSN